MENVFLGLRQRGKLILLNVSAISAVLPSLKGQGSCVLADCGEIELEVDELVEDIVETMQELEVEVLLQAND